MSDIGIYNILLKNYMLNNKKTKKQILRIKRRQKQIRIENRNREINYKRKQTFKITRRIFLRNKTSDNLNNLFSVIGKLTKVKLWHKNKGARLQSKFQRALNDNQ